MRYIIAVVMMMATLAGTACMRDKYNEFTYMYVVNQGENTISTYRIDHKGVLLDIGKTALPGAFNGGLRLHTNNKYLYVPLTGGNYVLFKADYDGRLASSTVYPNPLRGWAMTWHDTNHFSPNGKWHTAVDGSTSTLYLDSVNPESGMLTQLSTSGTSFWPASAVIHPNGRYCYVFCFAGNGYYVFSISESGILAPVVSMGAWPGANPPKVAVIHPSGKFMFGCDNPAPDMWSIPIVNDGADLNRPGSLTYPMTSAGNYGIFLHPNGKFVYALVGLNLYGYSIEQNTGILTPVPGSPYVFSTTPAHGAIHPDGNWIYVTDSVMNKLMVLNVDGNTGAVSFNRELSPGTGPIYIAVGRYSTED